MHDNRKDGGPIIGAKFVAGLQMSLLRHALPYHTGMRRGNLRALCSICFPKSLKLLERHYNHICELGPKRLAPMGLIEIFDPVCVVWSGQSS